MDRCPEVDAATRPAPKHGMGAMGAYAHEPRSLVHLRRHERARHRPTAVAGAAVAATAVAAATVLYTLLGGGRASTARPLGRAQEARPELCVVSRAREGRGGGGVDGHAGVAPASRREQRAERAHKRCERGGGALAFVQDAAQP